MAGHSQLGSITDDTDYHKTDDVLLSKAKKAGLFWSA
ncbi:hypothetical protein VSWAT3_00355 [Vibrionales bacterium SWAT-3]|nr:hypothetical protein VSWAT3_00355 [Vibrionales bacterium SWAT-3]